MPTFYKNSEDLNTLNSAKKKVMKDLVKQYKGYEKGHSAGSSEEVSALYDELVKKMTDMIASLFEVNATIGLTILPSATDRRRSASVGLSALADRFIAGASALLKQTAEIIAYTNLKLKNNLNIFNDAQMLEITELTSQLGNASTTFEDSLETIDQAPHLEQVSDTLRDLTENWMTEYDAWYDKFEQLVVNANKGVATSGYSEASDMASVSTGAGYTCKVGGSDYTPRRYL